MSDEAMSNFTPRAQQVLALARKEADRFNHNFVGTEHLLLGLIKLGQGTGVNVLQKMGLDLETVRHEVETVVGAGSGETPEDTNIPYTPRVKKVLALAVKEARALNHTYVGTEHILLGVLREGDGVAGCVLKNLGLDVEKTRQQILMELDPNYRPPDNPTGDSPPTPAPMPTKAPPQPIIIPPITWREPVDTSKRYDVYCGRSGQEVVYRNALFKGVKALFQKSDYDTLCEFFEIEQSDGQIMFVAKSSVVRFSEHRATPGAEDPSGKQP